MKRKPHNSLILSLILLMIFIFAFRKDISSINSKSDFKINFTPAKTSNELLDLKANPQANIVTTLPGFDAMVSSYDTPFSKLSSEELQIFRKSLVFRENKGIVSINFSVIKNKLSADDFAEVMSYFGIDTMNGYWGFSTNAKVLDDIRGGTVAQFDMDGQACVNRVCVKKTDNICLSGC